ncbi:unnamed protein product (macronuclear) [Paramecium tetraurelia]|uniref:Casein kinase I n=1 Tax=Paramecium tetraurelia TaxID=5888 RepID=A0BED8_PARTE|nr:uncharacterized protein GSPATT00027938001 [Paramecium tetraurelia]CAK56905.1 unnamed protein product [Paramecium tetraurelia]|eukprot:XP_001424303.1 hypothetical protein (macronuclear) [Paramecium tetraurelia strain d4-2]
MNQIQQGDVIDNQYEIIKKISQGSFGIVYVGKSLTRNKNVAIKVEKQEMASYSSLNREIEILKLLQGVSQIPELYWYGQFKKCNVMITNLLGHDLIYFQKQYQKFSTQCIYNIAFQMLWILEQIHSRNVIHRDLKPENILSKSDSEKIYLIDYGISRNLNQKPNRKKKISFIGTSRYASLAAHQGIEQSAKDDLESLGYLLIYLMKQSLPWMNIEKTDLLRLDKIGKLKSETKMEELCFDCPNSILKYMKYVKSLTQQIKPQYAMLRGLFLTKLHNFPDQGLDWTYQKSRSHKQKLNKRRKSNQNSKYQSCSTIKRGFLGESLVPQNVKTSAVQDELAGSSEHGSSALQFSAVTNQGSIKSIRVGFSLSDIQEDLKVQPHNNQIARISTFEGIIEHDPGMTLKAEQQLMERENQDLEVKYNLLHFKSVYFNFKNPIQKYNLRSNYFRK